MPSLRGHLVELGLFNPRVLVACVKKKSLVIRVNVYSERELPETIGLMPEILTYESPAMVILRVLILTLLIILTVNGRSDDATRVSLGRLPPSLQQLGPVSITTAKLNHYTDIALDAENAYARGDTQVALDRLEALSAVRQRLMVDAEADVRDLHMRIAADCWRLSMPVCVVENLEDAPDELEVVARDLRGRLARAHHNRALELVRRNKMSEAECHASAAVKFESTPERQALWEETRTRRGFIDQGLFDRQCISEIEKPLPEPTRTNETYFELINKADRFSNHREWKKSIAALVNAESSIQKLIALFQSDEKSELIAKADGETILNHHQEALRLLEAWVQKVAGTFGLGGWTFDESKLTGEEPERVKQTIAILRGSIALENFKAGVSSLESQQWQEAIDHFEASDKFLQLPENEIGIAAGQMKLDTGRDPLFQLGPSHLQRAITAYREYLSRWPDAPNRREVETLLDQLNQEFARRHDPNNITRAIGLAMASVVIRATNDMQQRYHDYLNSRRVDLWPSNVRNYIEFGGTNPPAVVINGQPVPLGSSPGRSPAGFSSSSTIPVFAELAANGNPPIPILPRYPDTATGGVAIIAGPGGEFASPSESSSGRRDSSQTQRRVELPPMEELRAMKAGRSIDETSLMPGDLIVSRANTVISDVIQIAGRSDVSHVMLYVGHGLIIEAVRGGVRLETVKRAVEENSYAMVMRNTQLGNPQRAIEYAYSKLGLPYDLWGVIFSPRFGRLGLAEPLINREMTDRYFCSQLVAEAYEHAGVQLVNRPRNVLPGDFPSFGFLDGIKYVGHLRADRQPSFMPIVERTLDFFPTPSRPNH